MSKSDLDYFVHKIDGIEYGGWFRLVGADCIEILAPGFVTVVPLNGRSVEEVSCRALEDYVRGRLRVGSPVPKATPASENIEPAHICNDRPVAYAN